MNAMLTPIELGHQIRELAHKMEMHGGVYPQWALVSRDIAPWVIDAVKAAELSLDIHIRDDMPYRTNFQLGYGDVP